MHGREAHLAARGRCGFRERDVAPFDLARRRPLQVQLDDRLGCSGRSLVSLRNLGPALRVCFLVGGVFGLGGAGPALEIPGDSGLAHRHGLAFVVLPDDSHDGAAARDLHILNLALGMETIVLAAGDGERLLPPAAQAFAIVCGDDQAAVACRPAFGIIRETAVGFRRVGKRVASRGVARCFLACRLVAVVPRPVDMQRAWRSRNEQLGESAGRTSFACILLPDGTPLDEGLARVLALMGTTPECFASFGDHGGLING